MPQAIAGIGAAWAAVGSISIAGLAVGTVIQGALIGAAIGGISSAVMGGDIGKGLLYGAVGGAVLGGISTVFNTGMTGTMTSVSNTMNENVMGAAISSGKNLTTSALAGASKGFTIGSMFSGLGDTAQASLIGLAGEGLKGAFAPDPQDTLDDQQAHEKEMAQMKIDAEKEIAKIAAASRGGGGGSEDHSVEVARISQETAREQLAEQRRQFESEKTLARESRERRANAVANIRAAREAGVLTGAPSIDQQTYEDSTQMYAQETPVPVQSTQPGLLKENPYVQTA